MKHLLTGEETERLRFRPIALTDKPEWLDFFKTKGTAEFIALGHLNTPEEKCETYFERCLKRYADGLGGLNVLIDKATNQMVGMCGLLIQTVDGVTRMEVGYSLLPQHWGKGYASEAAQKCRDYAFENNLTEDLISIIHIDNEASKKVARTNGMQVFTTTMYKDFPVDIFRITKDEWKALKK
jgi:Acetyltransferases, including N-acetylases of ribosomal proteins